MPFRCRSAEQCLILVNSQSSDISVYIKTVYLSGKTSTGEKSDDNITIECHKQSIKRDDTHLSVSECKRL